MEVLMDSIVDQLTEIEEAANAIVSHAIASKEEYDSEIKKKRESFDIETAGKTKKEIQRIDSDLEIEKKEKVEGLKAISDKKIKAFQKEYETNHEAYASMILSRITEVSI